MKTQLSRLRRKTSRARLISALYCSESDEGGDEEIGGLGQLNSGDEIDEISDESCSYSEGDESSDCESESEDIDIGEDAPTTFCNCSPRTRDDVLKQLLLVVSEGRFSARQINLMLKLLHWIHPTPIYPTVDNICSNNCRLS